MSKSGSCTGTICWALGPGSWTAGAGLGIAGGLLHVDVLAGLDGGLKVLGMQVHRSRDQHGIDVAGKDILVLFEAFASGAGIFAFAFASCWSTTSLIATILAPASLTKIRDVYVPRLPTPMTPTRTALFWAVPLTVWNGTSAAA
jgi:hypothetical protein